MFNQAQQLVRVEEDSSTLGEYLYNFRNLRVKKTTASGTTVYIYDVEGRIIQETTGALTKEYIYLDNILAAQVDEGTVYHYHTDHQGTPVMMTNAAGDVFWRAEYRPDGELAYMDVTGNVENNLRFPGQYYDAETDLHYNWHRYYKPEIGRYVHEDPIQFQSGDLNLYRYVQSNPVNSYDPLGLFVQHCRGPSRPFPYVDHHWLKTDTKEAGMGPAGGGEEGGMTPVGIPVEVTDHTGRSNEAKSSCKTVPNVDEDKVNKELEIGRSLGTWGPFNNCRLFVDDVLERSKIKPDVPNPTLPSL